MGWTDLRCPTDHPDLPPRRVDGAVMKPANENAVVGMSRAAVGVGDDVVISHQDAGTEQPGMRQPPSRRVIARRCAGVKQRS